MRTIFTFKKIRIGYFTVKKKWGQVFIIYSLKSCIVRICDEIVEDKSQFRQRSPIPYSSK